MNCSLLKSFVHTEGNTWESLVLCFMFSAHLYLIRTGDLCTVGTPNKVVTMPEASSNWLLCRSPCNCSWCVQVNAGWQHNGAYLGHVLGWCLFVNTQVYQVGRGQYTIYNNKSFKYIKDTKHTFRLDCLGVYTHFLHICLMSASQNLF